MYKEFDLERAKNGDPIVFKSEINGLEYREARILCFDRKSRDDRFQIIALIGINDEERSGVFDKHGCDPSGSQRLFMAPVKRQEWVNIYRDTSHPAGYRTGNVLHESQEAAEKGTNEKWLNQNNLVTTVLIREWEE